MKKLRKIVLLLCLLGLWLLLLGILFNLAPTPAQKAERRRHEHEQFVSRLTLEITKISKQVYSFPKCREFGELLETFQSAHTNLEVISVANGSVSDGYSYTYMVTFREK